MYSIISLYKGIQNLLNYIKLHLTIMLLGKSYFNFIDYVSEKKQDRNEHSLVQII